MTQSNSSWPRLMRHLVTSPTSYAALQYVLAASVNATIPLLLLPVMTRVLVPSDYGHIVMFQILTSLAATISSFGLMMPLLRAYTAETPSLQADFLASSLVVMAVATVGLCAVTVVFAAPLAAVFTLRGPWLGLALLAGVATTLFQIKLTSLRASQRAGLYGTLLNVQTLINVGLSLLFVLIFRLGWGGRVTAITLACVIMAVGAVATQLRGAIGKVRRPALREATTLGAGSLLHGLLVLLMSNGDRLLLSTLFDQRSLGIYVVAGQLAFGYSFFGMAVNLAWSPWVFRHLAQAKSQADIARQMRLMMAAGGVVVLGGLLYYATARAAFEFLIDAKYREAERYLGILVAGACLQNLYFIFSPPIFHYRETRLLATSGAITLAVAFASFFPLTHAYGLFGAAWTLCGLRLLMFMLTGALSLHLMYNATITPCPTDREEEFSDRLSV